MENNEFDLVVIGSGPGGYVGAIRAAQLGLKTAVIEKDKTFGGTCLNVGCIPSKALLDSSEHYAQAQNEFKEHGIDFKDLKLNLKQMIQRKNQVVKDLTGGIDFLFKKNKITTFKGLGQLISPTEVSVTTETGEKTNLKAKNIILATGSVSNELPFLKYKKDLILSSTEALELDSVPKKLLVVGAGAIGLELGSVWMRLGSEVTVIEFASKICGPMDKQLSKKLQMVLKKQGMKFVMDAKVTGAEIQMKDKKESGLTVSYELLKTKEKLTVDVDQILVATGRRPYAEGLGLENLSIPTDERGFVTVDSNYRTSHPNVFAIGDLIPGPMLAHKAEEEGVAVAEFISSNQPTHVNYSTVPSVIYTWPEFASVGKSEEQLKSEGIEYRSGSFPFAANGRAKAMGSTDGMVKILAHKTTDRILGVHILGPRASDVIAEAVIAMEFSGSAEDLALSFHAHPTLPEAIREAALAVDKRARQF